MADCGLFDGEVFVDTDGTYLGDFSYGDGPGGPFGWVGCMFFCDHDEVYGGIFDFFAPPDPCPCSSAVRVDVTEQYGTGRGYTVTDLTGPAGLEAMPAMRVDLPGAPFPALGWAGPQVFDETTGLWKDGVLTGSSGWTPALGETWIFQCYARVVPDLNGVTLADGAAELYFSGGPQGRNSSRPSADTLSLTSAWGFYQTTFDGGAWDIPARPWVWPLIAFAGDIENRVSYTGDLFGTPIPLTGYGHYGSVEIKCAHLYQPGLAGAGNWIDSFHGHG